MAGSLSEAEVQYVLSQGQLQLAQDVSWRRQGQGFKFTVPVGNSQDLDLMLTGYWNPRGGKFSFTLYYPAGNQPLRRYCSRGTHRNPGPQGEILAGSHKHEWRDVGEDRVAHVPPDITAQDVTGALRQFLAECQAAILVDLPDPPERQDEQLVF